MLSQALTAINARWSDQNFTPLITLWVFLGQVLGADQSCRAAVSRLIAHRWSKGQRPRSAETGAYCQARKRLRAGFEDGFDVLGRPAAVEHILFELSVRESIGQLKWRCKRGIMRFVGLLVMDSSRQYQAFGRKGVRKAFFFWVMLAQSEDSRTQCGLPFAAPLSIAVYLSSRLTLRRAELCHKNPALTKQMIRPPATFYSLYPAK